VADRLVVVERTTAHVHEAVLRLHRAEAPTTRAVLLFPQALGLLLRGLLQGAGRQPAGGGDSDLLHGIQIDVQTGAVVAESAPRDNSTPLLGELENGFFIFMAELVSWHVLAPLELRTISRKEFSPCILATPLYPTK
jgi:hypothetical protein